MLAARRSVAELINAPHDEEVVIGAATTSLLFLFTQALAPSLRPGDEVIVTDTDHEANVGCWMKLRAAGAILRVWKVNQLSTGFQPGTRAPRKCITVAPPPGARR